MEPGERPSKMRKLSHDTVELEQTKAQHLDESEYDLSKADEERASSQGEHNDNQSEADTADSADNEAPVNAEKVPRPVGMSKNAWKRLQKKVDWEAGREYRKVLRKEKIQAKKARDRAAKAEAKNFQPVANGTASKNRARKHVKLPITFLIDCSFDDLMMEKERISLGSQLTRSYSDNNRAPFQAHMVVSSWSGLLKERFDTILAKHHENWRGVVFTDKDFVEATEMAKNAMRGTHGGEMAGIFIRYRSADQPDVNSLKDNTQPVYSALDSDNTSAPKTVFAEKSDALPIDNADAKNEASSSQAAESERNEQIQDNGMRAPSHHISAAEVAASLEAQEAPREHNHVFLTTNGSAPANGQYSISSPTQNLSHGSTPNSEQGEIIYLTSDSPHTLDELKPYSTYIIGGLVDKNRHKGICYKTACEKGIKTAKLPIGEFMEMQSRFVLATNHVMEIMVRWLEFGDWGKAFLDVIPKRKGGKLRESTAEDCTEQDIEPRNSTDIGEELTPG